MLLSVSNSKTRKGEAHGWLTGIVHLAPAKLSGHNVCPMASKGCARACLNTAGKGLFPHVQAARIRRTKLLFSDRASFLFLLTEEITKLGIKAKKQGLKLAIRLNGTSDIMWERMGLIQQFPDVQFYDYTKIPSRLLGQLPSNYHLTFSRSESNEEQAKLLSSLGHNIAVVFDKLPKTYMGKRVVSGDNTDLRFLDPKGVIVGLTAKGKGRNDESGFTVRTLPRPIKTNLVELNNLKWDK